MKNLFLLLSLILFFSNLVYSQLPSAPTNLKIQYIFSSAIRIAWNDNSSDESGFIIERRQDGTNWTRINTVPANTINYADIGLSVHTKFYYRVCSYNIKGNSAYSNIAEATTDISYDCSAGTDTISTPYPFYTTYTDSRTQMLYRKTEMIGYCSVGYIYGISFQSKNSSMVSVSNVTVKMKSITDTILTKFIDTGMTVVYNNMNISIYYGWFSIYFYTPFVWDVNKNLLIEICYHTNSSATGVINLCGSRAPNKVVHRHKLASNGCTLDSGVVYENRPNFRMGNIIDGVVNISSNTPDDYSISQNYPNPFNGNTKFKFAIKEFTPVTLSIYDVLGRQELVVLSEALPPGEYEKTFSLSEHPLASGIYYYCFVTNGYVNVKKMVILK
jgi:hypothetical protein